MTKTTRQLQAEQTKLRILTTALELFQKKGFDNVSVDEIVKKSNSSKGAFYGHFASKYDIFMEKFKEIDAFYVQVEAEMPRDLNFKEKVFYLVEKQMHYLEFELGKDLMRTVYIGGLIEREENFFAKQERSLYKILEQFIEEAVKDGELPAGCNEKLLIRILSRNMRGILYDWLSLGKDFNLQEESKLYFTCFFDGFSGKSFFEED